MPVTGARGQAPLKGTCEGHMGFIVVVGEGVCVPFLREGGNPAVYSQCGGWLYSRQALKAKSTGTHSEGQVELRTDHR